MRKWVGLVLVMALSAPALAGLRKDQGLLFEWDVGFNTFYNESNVQGYSSVFKLAIQPAGNFSVAVFNESAQTSVENGPSGDIRLTGINLNYKQPHLDWTITLGGATCNVGAINDIAPFADIGVSWTMLHSEAEGVAVDVSLGMKHRFLDITDVVIAGETVRDLNMVQALLGITLIF